MKLPKTVLIGGVIYTVKTDKRIDAGRFEPAKQRIVIGTKSGKPDRIFSIYVHEVAEATMVERRLRYFNSNDKMYFVLDHLEFENLLSDISGAIFPHIK